MIFLLLSRRGIKRCELVTGVQTCALPICDGVLNVSVNCLDRHLAERGDDIALILEPDDPSEDARRYTYRELHAEVCRFANVLKGQGVKKGDRVTLYLPLIP